MRQAPGGEGKLMAQRVLGESLRLLFANLGTLFLLALAPALLIEAGLLLAASLIPETQEAGTLPPGLIAVALAGSLAGQVVIALVTLAGVDRVAGRTRSLDAYVAIAMRHLLPILVIGTLVSVTAGLAAMVFVLPGLYVYAMFFVWMPCILYEGQGFGALARAQALTRGHRWALMGAIGALVLIFIGVLVLAGPLWTALSAGVGSLFAAMLSAGLSALSYAVIGVFGGLVYLRLRYLEDGATPEQVAGSI
jgi:hypothetical protein